MYQAVGAILLPTYWIKPMSEQSSLVGTTQQTGLYMWPRLILNLSPSGVPCWDERCTHHCLLASGTQALVFISSPVKSPVATEGNLGFRLPA